MTTEIMKIGTCRNRLAVLNSGKWSRPIFFDDIVFPSRVKLVSALGDNVPWWTIRDALKDKKKLLDKEIRYATEEEAQRLVEEHNQKFLGADHQDQKITTRPCGRPLAIYITGDKIRCRTDSGPGKTSIAVYFDGKVYSSMKDLSEVTNVSIKTISYRARSGSRGVRFATLEEAKKAWPDVEVIHTKRQRLGVNSPPDAKESHSITGTQNKCGKEKTVKTLFEGHVWADGSVTIHTPGSEFYMQKRLITDVDQQILNCVTWL